jgi:hypothetical protein
VSNSYLDFLDQMAEKYGVPREELRAIYENETRSGRILGPSPAGATGHMQLMPGTAREMGVRDINDPYQNIEGGAKYYALQRRAFKDPVLAAAAYNAGPGRVRRAGGVPRISETQDYVNRFRGMLGNVTAAQPSATVPQRGDIQGQAMDETDDITGGLGGFEVMANEPDDSELAALAVELRGIPEKRAAMRDAQFKAAQERIQKMYGGPSSSQRLWALSQALLSPKPYKGFAGTLYNINQALGGMSERSEEAELRREQALAELQQSYDTSKFGDESEALKLRYQIGKEQAAERKAARKPDYRVIPEGGALVDIKEFANLPVLTPEEYAQIRGDPRYKGFKFRTADGRPMEIE